MSGPATLAEYARRFQAPAPDLPIERGRPGPGLIAHVAVSKYCDGLPLFRQSVILAREGVEIDRLTLADWIGRAGLVVGAACAANRDDRDDAACAAH